MNILMRIVFGLSLLALGLFAFDVDFFLNNRTWLYMFTAGFALSFILSFAKRNQPGSKIIMWISAIVIVIFIAYRLIVLLIWGLSN
ncbi:hypothetical protein EDD68_11193 [Melghiribacillus thermohalophilus]|uniref:Uncharacterized protein n=1 Tax=Melghiribacillus thermohalophilus TaxID=1324956 RepID=A0A4V2V1G9_9BACI|nr:hypothetical protein [Melghiribacillus thermohalophilus]TCT21132.1 hypothetical protein EDD68_11193 [Melghiribacillus thermohalophilus]